MALIFFICILESINWFVQCFRIARYWWNFGLCRFLTAVFFVTFPIDQRSNHLSFWAKVSLSAVVTISHFNMMKPSTFAASWPKLELQLQSNIIMFCHLSKWWTAVFSPLIAWNKLNLNGKYLNLSMSVAASSAGWSLCEVGWLTVVCKLFRRQIHNCICSFHADVQWSSTEGNYGAQRRVPVNAISMQRVRGRGVARSKNCWNFSNLDLHLFYTVLQWIRETERIESAAGQTERPESKTKQAPAQRHFQVYILLPPNKEFPLKICRQIIADLANSLVIALMTLNNPKGNEQQ